MTDRAPDRRVELSDLLRKCVQCGLCLPHCATWLATGNEVQSPRGRLILLNEVLSADLRDADTPAAFLAAFDQCIGCRACETACPGGVPFDLLEHGQGLAAARLRGAERAEPAVPGFVLRRLDRPAFLRAVAAAADLVRGVLRLLAGRAWRRRLDDAPVGTGRLVRLLGSMPCSPEPDRQLQELLDSLAGPIEAAEAGAVQPTGIAIASEGEAPSITLFTGCANRALLPGPQRRLVQLLKASGCEVEIPAGQDCCGALAAHNGRPGRAAALQQKNRDAFAGRDDARILVEAAGCGMELKQGLGELADRVEDAVDLLSRLPLPQLGRLPLRVAVHDPCHARHGQGIVEPPRALLRRIPGLEIVEAAEAEVCCGAGGAWGLRHPELSDELGRRKAAHLAATGADLVVTSNPGCLGQIADGLNVVAERLPVISVTDLVWFAWRRGGGESLNMNK